MSIVVKQSLEHLFGPTREQHNRPTCLAFAVSDCHAASRGAWSPLSVEYAFYHAQRRSGRTLLQGAMFDGILEALKEEGQPSESDWAYSARLPSDLSAWAPPMHLTDIYKRAGRRETPTFGDVVAALNAGQPVVIGMMLSASFYNPDARGVVNASAGEPVASPIRHAVLAVAHGEVDGERSVLIRNSWGLRWGQRGYGWLQETYLGPRLLESAILLENPHVLAS